MENTNRETLELITPSGSKVVLKAWITGREKRALRQPYFQNIKIGGAGVSDQIGGEIVDQIEDLTIQTLIISIDGKTDGILDTVLEMKEKDYQSVIDKINEITKETENPTKAASGIPGGITN